MAIAVVSTGGTIASTESSGGDATPSITAEGLIDSVPELEELASIETYEFSNVASQHFTIEQMFDLTELIHELDADRAIEGIVATHGTNALEETAYFTDLCFDGDTPVVFTGAMRNPSMTSPDGPANLLAAVRTALSERAGEEGVLVAFNDRVHTARDVSKTHSMNVDTFRSPEFGPLAAVDEDRVIWRRTAIDPDLTIYPERDDLTNDVQTVVVTTDMTDAQLRACAESDGLCLGTMGPGHLPPSITGALREVRDAGVPVVATTRSPEGRLYRDMYGYAGSEHFLQEIGCYYSDLNLQKTRIKAIVAIAADRLTDAFEQPRP